MKTCSTCGNSFSDDLSFCLQDGTVLKSRVTADISGEPTEVFKGTTERDADISNHPTIVDHPTAILPPPPASAPQKVFQMKALEPASRMGCVLSIGQVAAALVVVVGLGIVGVMFLNTKNEVAMTTANARPPVANSSYSNSAMNSMNTGSTAPHPGATGDGVKTISAGDITADAITRPQPAYPPTARQSGVSGAVEVHVLVDEKGTVISATATSGHVLLRAAAENAAREAKFRPTLVDGVPVRVTGVITYNFVL